MNTEKLAAAVSALKTLIAEQKRYEALRDKAGSTNHATMTRKRIQAAHTNMHFQAMHVRRCHKAVWQAIVDADLETSLAAETASPSMFQTYSI